ncbi:hypothetical protein [Pseudomonas sp. PDM16]|uniref:hypothetical protein n=1 Tax=Pseudomonas sp. PDM16 TaxID=2769292 RepID=UPI00177CDC08|nr:hypothetical protein [Pseudomonas sp. PDM16]
MSLTDFSEFKTFSDIQGRFDIALDLLLNKENFSRGVWPYNLYQPEVSCQYEKHGKRCSQQHQKGYIVACKDGAVVLIGHCCAHKHLSLDDESLRASFKMLDASERQASRRRKVEALLEQRQAFIEQGKAVHMRHRELQARVYEVESALPRQIWHKLVERWKSNSLEVIWEYQTTKVGVDENGRKVTERAWYPSSYGKLQGLGIWLQLGAQEYAGQISDFRKQLELIPVKGHLTSAEIDHAETTFNSVAAIKGIERELESQFKLLEDFLNLSNLVLTVQLVSNQAIRAETVVAVHQLTGQTLAGKPDKFVAEIDLDLKRKHDATGVRIQQ